MRAKNGPKVLICIPAYDEMVHAGTMMSVYQTMADFLKRDWGIGVEIFGGGGAIHMARNYLVSRFLHSSCTDLFFLDADVACDPGSIVRMVEHDVDVVLGMYRARCFQESYLFLSYPHGVDMANNGLCEIRGGPCGFMRIRRHVLERMAAELHPNQWIPDMQNPGSKIPHIFEFGQRFEHYVGEDIGFCLKWREMGGRIWMDPDITLHHIGKQVFTSNFGRSWDAAQSVSRKELEAFEGVVNG